MTATMFDSTNATTVSRLTLVESAVDDPATRSWERGAKHVPREGLLSSARSKISRLMMLPNGWDGHRAATPTPIAGMAVNGVLERLVFDSCPTPQVTPSPDGGMDVEWLVAGVSVSVSVSGSGYITLSGEGAGGNELLYGEFPVWNPDFILLDQAKAYLEKMSHDVERRVVVP